MKPPAWAMNLQRSSLFQEPQSNLIIKKNTDRYVESQSQFGKWDRQEWSKHENSYRENKSVLLAVPLDPNISDMSSLFSDKKSNCSSSSPRKSVGRDWTNYGRCCSFHSMEPKTKARISEDKSNKGDLDTPDIPYHYHPCNYAPKSRIQAHPLFELIKTHCLGNPILMKKVVEWCINHAESNHITTKEILDLSRGRYWITARSATPLGDKHALSFKEDLDDLQGAYQEFYKGVFQQLIPEGREQAVKHRLFKYKLDWWAIDKWEAGVWRPVAREKGDRLWVDLRYNKTIHVKVIPLLRILRRLEEKFQPYQKIDKYVEFLFTSFDRKKLNGKLKTRNLKHNIANLKLKLEKQYALNFAINVATTADCISIDD